MPLANVNGVSLHYELSGLDNGPPLLFSNALGTDHTIWDKQATALSANYRVIRYDTRGHGKSGYETSYKSVGVLADDALALLDHLDIKHTHFCGLSLGGLTGQAIALTAPQRLISLTLANTGAHIPTRGRWDERIADVEKYGLTAVTPKVIERWFTPTFRAREADRFKVFQKRYGNVADSKGYIACCIAVRDADFRSQLSEITTPTLVIAGDEDIATPTALAQELAVDIPLARLEIISPAAHLSNLEQPDDFNKLLAEHLKSNSV